jgi:type II secretory pathway component PulF
MVPPRVRTARRRAAIRDARHPERSCAMSRAVPDPILAAVFGRLAVAVAAGIDLRRAWAAESARVPARHREAMAAVAAGLEEGDDLSTALARADGGFSAVVRGLVRVGDRTGRLAEMLRDTSAALAAASRACREFRASLVRPALQLCLALAVVGLLIALAGVTSGLDGRPLDLLGLGLVGTRGLIIYTVILVAALVAGCIAVPLASASWRRRGWARVIGGRLPLIGPAARAAEAAEWCRVSSLAAHAGLPIGELVSLASAAAPGLAVDPPEVESRLRAGDDLATALARPGRLPARVLEAVAVGEMTGTTAETLERQIGPYEDEARRGFTAAVQAAGFAAWAVVACLVALVVVRVVGVYAGMIQDLARPQ